MHLFAYFVSQGVFAHLLKFVIHNNSRACTFYFSFLLIYFAHVQSNKCKIAYWWQIVIFYDSFKLIVKYTQFVKK